MGDFTGNMASTNVSRNPDTLLCTADLLNWPGELLNGRSNVQQQERTVLELEETVSERSTKGEDHWRTWTTANFQHIFGGLQHCLQEQWAGGRDGWTGIEKVLNKSSTPLVASGFGSVTCRPANFIVFFRSYPEKKRRKGDITASRIGREKDHLQSILLLKEVKLMLWGKNSAISYQLDLVTII